MKVVHLVAGNLYGGVEAFLVTLARYRGAAPGMEPIFAVCFEGRLSQELEQQGVRVHYLGNSRLSRPWSVWRARQALRRVLAREQPNVVVCHGAWPHVTLGPAARRLKLPLVFFQHDAANGKHWLERLAHRFPPDRIVANSRFTATTTTKVFGAPEPVVFHYPVPPIPLLAAEERARLRAELGVRDEQALIIQTSRIEPWKGLHKHLAALGQLRDREDWVSALVGGPQRAHEAEYYAELKGMAADLGIADRVRFLGQRSDVARLLGAADIHFQPNQGPEPFGIAFIEAMLAGLPIATYRLGALPEYVSPDVGLLADTDAQLVDALRTLLDERERRRAMGAQARERAETLCHPAHQVPEFGRILASAAPGDSSNTRFHS